MPTSLCGHAARVLATGALLLALLAGPLYGQDWSPGRPGADSNANGIPDDVESALEDLYAHDYFLLGILRGGARSFQQAIRASETETTADDDEAALAFLRFLWCLNDYSETSERDLAALRSLVLDDDDARRAAYLKYDIGRHGSITPIVPLTTDQCISYAEGR